MNKKLFIGLGLIGGLVASGGLHATVLTFQQGFGGYSGTLTREIASGQPDVSFTSDRVSVDSYNAAGSPDRAVTQGLIRFDNIFGGTGIPGGATITAASLRFWTKSYSPGPVTIHQMLTNWNGSVTWNVLGGDGIANDINTIPDDTIADITDEALVAFDVTNSLVAWAGGASNFGWGLQNTDNDGWDFNSETYTGTSDWSVRRPLLTVQYRTDATVPEPSALALLGLGLAGIGFVRNRKKAG